MEDYSRYSTSWMCNVHHRGDEHFMYGGGVGGGGGSTGGGGSAGAGDLRNADGFEDFGNSLDQLNKIVERIAPEGRSFMPKKDIGSRRAVYNESHFNDNAYETYLGYGGNECSSNEMLGDCSSGYEGSAWGHPVCGPYHGGGFLNADGRVRKAQMVAESRTAGHKDHDPVPSSRESRRESRSTSFMGSAAENNKCLNFENFEDAKRLSFENCKLVRTVDDSQDDSYADGKHRTTGNQETSSKKQVDESDAEEPERTLQRTQSPGWSSSKQLLEIGKYTELGGRSGSNDESPRHTSGPLTSYSESSVNYDSLSGLSTGGAGTYLAPSGERAPSDCTDAKADEDLKLYNCSQCSYRATKKGQLRKHMSVHGVFLCAHCEFSSEHGDSLEAHRRAHHPGLCGRKLCKKCRVLYQGDELKEHERLCSGEKQRWPCPTCNKEFKFLSVMKAHVRKWHPSATSLVGNSSGGDCFPPMADSTTEEIAGGSDMDSEQSLVAKSVQEMDTEESFRCEDCDKTFNTKWMLSNHMVLHCSNAPFFCDTNGCSTTFRSDKELNVHRMKVHELGPKKYPCCHPDCTMQFAKYGHYKRHRLTHLGGDRMFKCDWPNCGKAFSHTDNLKVHYRRHTDEKPYKCQRCESAYRQKSGLKYHLEKVHDEKSSGRPGRKRKNAVCPTEGHPERSELVRDGGRAIASDADGRPYKAYNCPVSSIFNESERGFPKMVSGSNPVDASAVKRPRMDVSGKEDEAAGGALSRNFSMHHSRKAETVEGEQKLDEKSREASDEVTSVSHSNRNASSSSSSHLGEIGLNDEWVIDESFRSDQKLNEDDPKQPVVVDSSSDFRCITPKMEPLDVDLGEELRRLSDVISEEIAARPADAKPEALPDDADGTDQHSSLGLSQFVDDQHLGIADESDCVAYPQSFTVPSTSEGPYRNHPDLSDASGKGIAGGLAKNIGRPRSFPAVDRLQFQSYGQFCYGSQSSNSKSMEVNCYSASDSLHGFAGQLHPPSTERAATSRDLGDIPTQPMSYDALAGESWMSPASVIWSTSRVLDDTSPASGRSTRSERSHANSGDIADHYREAHSTLLPTCSPIVVQPLATTEEAANDANACVGRSTAAGRHLPQPWSRDFEEEDDDGAEDDEGDDEEEEEEEEEDDDGEEEEEIAGNDQWSKQGGQFENWCPPPFPDRRPNDVDNAAASSSASAMNLPAASAEAILQDDPVNYGGSTWSDVKRHESLAFGSHGAVAVCNYETDHGARTPGWSGQSAEGPDIAYRKIGDDDFLPGFYKRTHPYGMPPGPGDKVPGTFDGARGKMYNVRSQDQPLYYSSSSSSSNYLPTSDSLAYRYYYGHGSPYLNTGHQQQHPYSQANMASYGHQLGAGTWQSLEDSGFRVGPSDPQREAPGHVQSPSYVYPAMPPYF